MWLLNLVLTFCGDSRANNLTNIWCNKFHSRFDKLEDEVAGFAHLNTNITTAFQRRQFILFHFLKKIVLASRKYKQCISYLSRRCGSCNRNNKNGLRSKNAIKFFQPFFNFIHQNIHCFQINDWLWNHTS